MLVKNAEWNAQPGYGDSGYPASAKSWMCRQRLSRPIASLLLSCNKPLLVSVRFSHIFRECLVVPYSILLQHGESLVGRKQYENRARRSWWSVHIEAWRRSGVSLRSYCAALKETGAELSERLKQFTRAFPDISSIWVLDRNCDALVSSMFFPIPAAFNPPERSHLKSELAQDRGVRVGAR